MALNWKKVPSVRPGGKPYFYVSITPHGKRTVVWDRLTWKWALLGDQEPPRGEAPVLGLFATASAAMKFAEKGQKTKVASFPQQPPQFPFRKQIAGLRYTWVITETSKRAADSTKKNLTSGKLGARTVIKVVPMKIGRKTWYGIYSRGK